MTTTDLAQAARAGVHAMVRSLGATAVQLQMPLPPVPEADIEALGLATPVFQRTTLSPVAVRRTAKECAILVPADVLEAALGVQGSGAIATAVAALSGVLAGDERFIPTGTEVLEVCGGVCLYRLLLLPHGTEVA